MKISSIILIIVENNLQNKLILKHIFSLFMKVSSILVICVIIKLQQWKQCLQKHIKYKHEGIKYPCDQCDQQFTGKGHLKKHIQTYNVQTSVIKSQIFLLFEFIFENFFTSGPSL